MNYLLFQLLMGLRKERGMTCSKANIRLEKVSPKDSKISINLFFVTTDLIMQYDQKSIAENMKFLSHKVNGDIVKPTK